MTDKLPQTQPPPPAYRNTPAASFRDPSGSVFAVNGRLLRLVQPSASGDLTAFLASPPALQWVREGCLVPTAVLDIAQAGKLFPGSPLEGIVDEAQGQMLLEHERIPFPSFPYEWSPEMLYAAATLTMDLAEKLLPEGFGLKDATPYNILFRGSQPVFIDLLSFERRDPHDPTWLPYAQFVRTFLLPLLASKRLSIPLDQIFTTRRDGLDPEEIYRWSRALQKFSAPFLTLATIPTWLASRHNPEKTGLYEKKSLGNAARARFVLESTLRQLRRALNRLAPQAQQTSVWSGYMNTNHHYSREQFQAKEVFVRDVLKEFRPKKVLDVGCNTGHFSAMAAQSGASVVSIDYDPVVVDQVFRQARSEGLNILPLQVNLARPTPALGWRNRENPSFLARASGAFDAVFMLAVIHHMLVTERVPLDEILDLAWEITTDLLVIEFVAPNDPMFGRLTRGRDHLHSSLNDTLFEKSCRRRFHILRSERLRGASRWLFLLRRKSSTGSACDRSLPAIHV